MLEFVRNDVFDARPFFLPSTSHKPPLRQNQFGFEVDGPIIIPKLYDGRNRTFFMGSYEGLRQIRATFGASSPLTGSSQATRLPTSFWVCHSPFKPMPFRSAA